MADAGIGETLLASEIIGSTAAAGETAGAIGAGTALGEGALGSGATGYGLGAGGFAGTGVGSGLGYGGAGLGGLGLGASGYAGAGAGLSALEASYGLGSGIAGFAPGASALVGTGSELAGSSMIPGALGAGASTGAMDAALSQAGLTNPGITNPTTNPEFLKDPIGWMMNNKAQTALTAGGIYTLANILKGGALTKPNLLPAYNPVTAQSMGLGKTLSPNYQRATAHAAGGLMSTPPTPGLMDGGQAGNVDFMGGDMYPTSQQHRSYYATPTQMPTSAQSTMASYEPKTNPLTGEMTANMASGGIADLGSYSDGGRMLKGPGDGMSDNIPATIGGKQPARLADGEFVVPADVVSHLGNGSTDAGAKQLYSMMDKVRKARTGTKKQGKEINPNKFLKA